MNRTNFEMTLNKIIFRNEWMPDCAVTPVLHSSGVHLENHQSCEDFSLLIRFYRVHSWKFSRFPLPADQRVKINSTDTVCACNERQSAILPETRDSSRSSIRLHPGAASPWPRRSTLNNCTNNKNACVETSRADVSRRNRPFEQLVAVLHIPSFFFFFFLRWMMLLLIHS